MEQRLRRFRGSLTGGVRMAGYFGGSAVLHALLMGALAFHLPTVLQPATGKVVVAELRDGHRFKEQLSAPTSVVESELRVPGHFTKRAISGGGATVPQESLPVPEEGPALVALAAEPVYQMDEVDSKPFPADDTAFEFRGTYPPGRAGRVVLSILIRANGEVENVSLDASDFSPMFNIEVVALTKAIQFIPALKAGSAVRSRMTVEVNFGEDAAHHHGNVLS